MSQLESMKYLSPEMLGQMTEQASPVVSNAAATATAPASASNSGRLATASDLGMAQWTMTLTVVMGFMTLLGAWGAIGGVIELIGLASLESSLELVKKMGSYGADVAASVAMTQAQIDNRMYLYLVAGIRVLVGISFLGAMSMMKTKQADANRLAALVCVGAIFYNLLMVLGVWICIPAEIPGLPAEAMAGVTAFAMVAAFVGLGFKVAIYSGLIAYLMNKNNCALFTKTAKSESLC